MSQTPETSPHFETAAEVRTYLAGRIEQTRQALSENGNPDELAQAAPILTAAHDLLEHIEIRTGKNIDPALIWEKYLSVFYGRNTELYQQLMADRIQERKAALAGSDSLRDTVAGALQIRQLSSGSILHYAVGDETLLCAPGQIDTLLEQYAENPDDFVRALEGGISALETHEAEPNGSFILMKHDGANRFVFGAEVEDNRVVRCGVNRLSAICHITSFDTVAEELHPYDIGDGYTFLPVPDSFVSLFEQGIDNPYKWPPASFLLRTCTDEHWGAVKLEESMVSEKVQAAVSARAKPV